LYFTPHLTKFCYSKVHQKMTHLKRDHPKTGHRSRDRRERDPQKIEVVPRFLQILSAVITLGTIGQSISDILGSGNPAPEIYIVVETIAAIQAIWSVFPARWIVRHRPRHRHRNLELLDALELSLDILFMGAYIANVVLLGGDAIAPEPEFESKYFSKRSEVTSTKSPRDYSLVKVAFAFCIVNVNLYAYTAVSSFAKRHRPPRPHDRDDSDGYYDNYDRDYRDRVKIRIHPHYPPYDEGNILRPPRSYQRDRAEILRYPPRRYQHDDIESLRRYGRRRRRRSRGWWYTAT
jgi:hypothetical protein